jgi:hypothetical protein
MIPAEIAPCSGVSVMRLRLPLLLIIVAIAFFLAPRADAADVRICNHGDTALNTARAVYSQSFFFGNSYRVSGWYVVNPGKCEVVYSADDPENIYLGFTYLDSKGTLRIWEPDEDSGDDVVKVVSDTFCAGVGIAYDYTTKTRGASSTSCQDNYSSMEFTMYLALDSGNWGQLTYSFNPHKFSTGGPIFSGPTAAAKMMFGGEVHLVGNTWKTPDGSKVAAALINSKNLPPLGPKQQYSVAKAPVAGSIKQITDVLSTFHACHENEYGGDSMVLMQAFAMDDRGVITSVYYEETGPNGEKSFEGVALRSIDVGNTAPIDRGDCWELQIPCVGGVFCVQHGEDPTPEYGAAKDVWDLWVNTKAQATTVLNALKSMTPYYPDVTPEIHELN